MSQTNLSNSSQRETLTPSHQLPLIIVGIGLLLLLLPWSPWPTIIISSFGLFLLLQSFTLKLEFTDKDLVVWQLGKELRRFPYKYWIAWKIFFPNVPGFFYFREEASPHLLPILFNPEELELKLKSKLPDLEIKNN